MQDTHTRRTRIQISLPAAMVEHIRETARRDYRTTSQQIEHTLKNTIPQDASELENLLPFWR